MVLKEETLKACYRESETAVGHPEPPGVMHNDVEWYFSRLTVEGSPWDPGFREVKSSLVKPVFSVFSLCEINRPNFSSLLLDLFYRD